MDENKEDVATLKKESSDGVALLNSALEEAKKGNADFKAVSEKWENLETRITDAEDTLKRMVETGNMYFQAQEAKLAQMKKNPDLRDKTREILEQKKKNLVDKFREVRSRFQEMRSVRLDVKDIIIALEVQVSLAAVDQQIADLEQLKQEVDKIIDELQNLNEEASKIVQS